MLVVDIDKAPSLWYVIHQCVRLLRRKRIMNQLIRFTAMQIAIALIFFMLFVRPFLE